MDPCAGPVAAGLQVAIREQNSVGDCHICQPPGCAAMLLIPFVMACAMFKTARNTRRRRLAPCSRGPAACRACCTCAWWPRLCVSGVTSSVARLGPGVEALGQLHREAQLLHVALAHRLGQVVDLRTAKLVPPCYSTGAAQIATTSSQRHLETQQGTRGMRCLTGAHGGASARLVCTVSRWLHRAACRAGTTREPRRLPAHHELSIMSHHEPS